MKTEKAFFIIFLIGLVFKLLKWEGSGLILTLSLLGLAILYFPFCFYFFSDKIIKNQNMLLTVIVGIFLLPNAAIGVLFILQKWEGGVLLLTVGLAGALISLATTLYLKKTAPENLDTYYHNMVIRTATWSFMGVLAFCYHWNL